MGVYEDFVKHVEEMSFVDKIKMVKDMNDRFSIGQVKHEVWRIGTYGFLKDIRKYSLIVDDVEHDYYVYVWRHAWGGPFYVGSGKGDRWLSRGGRCDDFYLHLDQADAVVYKVLDGVDSKTARLFEKYVSVNLIEAGYTLANGDNNTEHLSDEARKRRVDSCKKIDEHELAEGVQKAVISILNDNPNCNYRATDMFLMEYGTDYFSRKYVWGKEV